MNESTKKGKCRRKIFITISNKKKRKGESKKYQTRSACKESNDSVCIIDSPIKSDSSSTAVLPSSIYTIDLESCGVNSITEVQSEKMNGSTKSDKHKRKVFLTASFSEDNAGKESEDNSVCIIDSPVKPDVVILPSSTTEHSELYKVTNTEEKIIPDEMNLQAQSVECKENILCITLSDSEDNADKESHEDSVTPTKCSITPRNTFKFIRNVLTNCKKKRRRRCKKNKIKKMSMVLKDAVASASTEDSRPYKVNSTTKVIPKKSHYQRNKGLKLLKKHKIDGILKEPAPCRLRPIVIDGSNIAIHHGEASHTFSSKGIQLAIDYFLNRGHTQITTFVPQFRRTGDFQHNFPTVGQVILEDLAKKQFVVFTPSRRINGKCISSYDDRFIVQLASVNGGIIVSNDNYRDLVNESAPFKEAIEKRLLMYCFVGDVFMVPDDPLGRYGPRLKEYLCFPPHM